jgi:hypothetical protein
MTVNEIPKNGTLLPVESTIPLQLHQGEALKTSPLVLGKTENGNPNL